MSKDDKETPELRLGLQACLQPGFHFEKQWSPGVRVTSPEEFDQFAAQLAQNLLDTYSPEHIATIAAQRTILLDMTQCAQRENEVNQDLAKALTETAMQVGFLAFCAHRKKAAKKRMAGGLDELNKRAAFIGSELQRHAKDIWDADTHEEYRVTEVAHLVKGIVEREYPSDRIPGLYRIKELIKDHAPLHARKGGAPKGKRTRSKP
ncbi:hypothetical protein CDR19_11280 [Ectopseudomonas toyotomiensis]|uniref:Uncharacterized protein n=1 Tax=Ectopseudomonas toyotomiensis TaxID=554344 RepID=A0A1I5W0A1_9GAMM|nr:hypothetical protein [Pseudomonas toyotomiensis]PIA72811.1 hypothetical protein CDR19_11280 [Pseudomonas toyotomiensis]SFQ13073.1 hypothetical protein SAMN05216177_10850 [Pseudomonas toyotomiensis]